MSVLEIRAEIPGTVVTVDSVVGKRVERGATLLAIESMKMEFPILAPADGLIEQIKVAVGDMVEESQILVLLHA